MGAPLPSMTGPLALEWNGSSTWFRLVIYLAGYPDWRSGPDLSPSLSSTHFQRITLSSGKARGPRRRESSQLKKCPQLPPQSDVPGKLLPAPITALITTPIISVIILVIPPIEEWLYVIDWRTC